MMNRRDHSILISLTKAVAGLEVEMSVRGRRIAKLERMVDALRKLEAEDPGLIPSDNDDDTVWHLTDKGQQYLRTTGKG